MLGLYKNIRQRLNDSSSLPMRALRTLLFPLDVLHLAASLIFSASTTWKAKIVALLSLLYILSPIDIVPEFVLGLLGLADDSVLGLIVLHSIIGSAEDAAVAERWAGDERGLRWLMWLRSHAPKFLSVLRLKGNKST